MMHKTKKLLFAAIFACSDLTIMPSNTSVSSDSSAGCSTSGCSGCAQSQNLWQPHAFAICMARDIILEKTAWNGDFDNEGWFGTFDVGFEYMKSLGAGDNCMVKSCCNSIGSLPFWSATQSNQMTVGDNSGAYNLDAYQMGLGPVTTSGTVLLAPTIYQAGGDFFLYFGAHKAARGIFFKLHGPVGLTCVDTRISHDCTLIPREYPTDALDVGESVDPLYCNIAQAFQGGKTAGDLEPLTLGRILFKRTSEAKFGDLVAAIGYNFYADETKHIGGAIRFTAPTGNVADATMALQPIFGRNGHWAVGGEVIAHWTIWQNDDDFACDIWFDGAADHLFKSQQPRAFDLKGNGLGSKYLLLANYANNTYQNEITNAVNVTTLPIISTFSVEGDFAFMFNCHSNKWSVGVGYEGWGRSCEQLAFPCGCPALLNLNNYAILGRQNVVNNLCQPTATIGKSEDAAITATATILDATDPKNRIHSDIAQAVNIDGQRAHAAYTSKVFGQTEYIFDYTEGNPYIALSGSAEFSHKKNSAVSFWSIGLQGGVAF